jgi:hypothetical protein
VEISLQATLNSKGGGLGLFCRYTNNNRYEFFIQQDGKWFIRRNTSYIWQPSRASTITVLAHGALENFSPQDMKLSATCNGPNLIFTLNGTELGRAQDTLYSEGQAGIFFDSFSEGSFTNLTIKRAK